MCEYYDWRAVEVGTDTATELQSHGKKENGYCETKKKKKKAISVVSYSCRFISLTIQTHRSPLNCFIEQ